jgi:hypothetical protein
MFEKELRQFAEISMVKNRKKFTQCPSRGYTIEEGNNSCPNYGQENHDFNIPVKHLVEEFLKGTLYYAK